MFRLTRVFCLSLLIAAAPLLAQSGLGSITGIVQDSSGGIIARAAVRLTQNRTQVSREPRSQRSGPVHLPVRRGGTYTVTVRTWASRRSESRISA